MALHEHKASPQSEPRARRKGGASKLLSTTTTFFFKTDSRTYRRATVAEHTSRAQGSTELNRLSTRHAVLSLALAQSRRNRTRTLRLPSSRAHYHRSMRPIVTWNARSIACQPQAKKRFAPRTVQRCNLATGYHILNE